MKKQTIEKFINIVKEQKSLYSSLKELISTEYKALTDKDIKSIDEIIKKQDGLILSIKKLEDEKSSIFDLLIEEAGLKKDPAIKLSDVLLKMDKKDAKTIENAVLELISVVKETELVNAQNTDLIKNYIKYVDFVRNVKEKMEAQINTTYTEEGIKKSEVMEKKSQFDTTI